jgi:hypothetical protein
MVSTTPAFNLKAVLKETGLSAEVEWLKVLLQSYEKHPQQLIHFMETYLRAVNKNLNGSGRPIIEWFTVAIEKLRAL